MIALSAASTSRVRHNSWGSHIYNVLTKENTDSLLPASRSVKALIITTEAARWGFSESLPFRALCDITKSEFLLYQVKGPQLDRNRRSCCKRRSLFRFPARSLLQNLQSTPSFHQSPTADPLQRLCVHSQLFHLLKMVR